MKEQLKILSDWLQNSEADIDPYYDRDWETHSIMIMMWNC